MRERFFDCITDFLFLEDEPQRADVIFVPGGHYPDSARRAAALFLEGYAPLILPSGHFSKNIGHFAAEQEGDADRSQAYETEFSYMRDILLSEGVPENAILREEEATFTWENAIFSRHVLEREGIRVSRAIIVCQAFHARRCKMYYQEQFPESRLFLCPVKTRGISRTSWYLDGEKIDTVLGELERCGSQFHRILKSKLEDPSPAEHSFTEWW